ncbi:hypothetical protein MY8738_005313 [Beauveria namnaoensis]
MDGVSAAASVIGVIQICGSIFNLCRSYYTRVKDARKDITRLRNEISRLESLLTGIADLADADDSAKLYVLESLVKPGGALSQCQNDLIGLLDKLQGAHDKDGIKPFGWRALTWPLKSKDVNNAIIEIERHKSLFQLALTADAASLSKALGRSLDEVAEKISTTQLELRATQQGVIATFEAVKAIQKDVDEEDKKNMIRDLTVWLTYADPAASHQAAHRKRQPGTGTWLINGVRFREWKRRRGSFMWLKGIPGCGKTILASTVIEHLKGECEKDPGQILAYFYFEFNDTNKQSPRNCLSSVISQLCSQSKVFPAQLKDLYERCGSLHGPPSVGDLISTLSAFAALEKVEHIYIIMDALDECPRTGHEDQRAELLEAVKAIQHISPSKIHFLVTSRQELDIEESITTHLTVAAYSIQDSGVTADIGEYINSQLASDRRLNSWSEDIKKEIESVLTRRAGGMFRWVVCQLDELKKSKKRSSILLALKQLPKTLDETYERMLLSIDEMYKGEARRALLWLAFSERQLSAEEVAEAACIDPDADSPFSEDDRFQDPRNNILEILGSLREDAPFSLCELPFIAYACMYWPHHAQQLTEDDQESMPLIKKLYHSLSIYKNWQSTLAPLSPVPGIDNDGPQQKILSPLRHASAMGFSSIVEELLSRPEIGNAAGDKDNGWTALHTAVMCGRTMTASIILRRTKDCPIVNVVSPRGTTALHIAASKGFAEIVLMLLSHGASITIEDSRGRGAVELAAASRQLTIVQLLLENDVASDLAKKHKRAALFSAIEADCASIVQTLLENGANTEMTNSSGLNALLFATMNGRAGAARSLLEYGANPNCADLLKSTPLHRAVQKGDDTVVNLLIQHGADPARSDCDYKTPFHYACARGSPSMVRMFLQRGVDLLSLDGWGKMPIHYAACAWSAEAMQILLDSGAQLEARTPRGETPLHLASQRGGDGVILLRYRADPRVKDYHGYTPIQAYNKYEHETARGGFLIRRIE